MADTYLSRTPGSAGNQQIWTLSAWIKKSKTGTANQNLFSQTGGGSASQRMYVLFSDDLLVVSQYNGSSSDFNYTTNALFRDPSAWYHLVVSVDTTQATDSNRVKIYINGEQITSFSSTTHPSQNLNTYVNTTQVIGIGHDTKVASRFFDGYMAEMHLTDGTAYAASTFGATNSDGVWGPIVAPSVTYGTNGFYLKFENSGAMGTDSSGNSNTFSVGGGTVRQVPDTPTNNFATLNILTSGVEAGYSDGNLRFFADSTQTYPYGVSTIGFSSGKWYCEMLREANAVTGGVGIFGTDLTGNGDPTTLYVYYNTGNKYDGTTNSSYGANWGEGDVIGIAYDGSTGNLVFYKNGVSQGTAFTVDTSAVWTFGCQSYTSGTQVDVFNFGQDGTFAGNKTAGGNSDTNGLGNFLYTVPTGHLALCTDNLSSELTIPVNDGSSAFHTQLYTGTGSARTITNDANSGDFQPDWVWVKHRNDSTAHSNNLVDAIRGGTKTLYSNSGGPEETITQGITGFATDGFTLGTNVAVNNNNINYKAWQWKAGSTAPANTYAVKVVSDNGNKYRFDDYGTSAITLELQEGGTFTFDQSDSSNAGHPIRFSTTSDGTHGGGSEYTTGVTTTGTPGQAGAKTVITVAGSAPTLYYYCSVHSGMGGQANTDSLFGFTNVKGATQTVVSPNDTAGFSIIKFTGTGGDTTIGHGLSSAPKMVILKNRIDVLEWAVYHRSLGAAKRLLLNTTDGVSTSSSFWNSTSPSSTVISLGSSGNSNGSSDSMIAYAFAEIEGYSKFSSYTGNGSSDGTFVYTGFRPAYLMTRRTSAGSDGWAVFDSARDPTNGMQYYEFINNGSAEGSGTIRLDFVSNGFKWRQSGGSWNGSGEEYIYMAFAENPLVTSTGKPVTAR